MLLVQSHCQCLLTWPRRFRLSGAAVSLRAPPRWSACRLSLSSLAACRCFLPGPAKVNFDSCRRTCITVAMREVCFEASRSTLSPAIRGDRWLPGRLGRGACHGLARACGGRAGCGLLVAGLDRRPGERVCLRVHARCVVRCICVSFATDLYPSLFHSSRRTTPALGSASGGTGSSTRRTTLTGQVLCQP
jgi:hypothetical protein